MKLIVNFLSDKILRFANASDLEQTSNDSMSDLQSQGSSFFNKNSNLSKNKKSRKSPAPEDAEVGQSISKSDGVRSPAYSDISDDSNTATENNLNGKFVNVYGQNLDANSRNSLPQISLKLIQILRKHKRAAAVIH